MAAKINAAAKARRHLYIIARTDAAASEGMDGAIARARLYIEAGADAIFPEALTSREMLEEFARRIDVPLLANMTEFGQTPLFTADEFRSMGYSMIIWPVSALRMAANAHTRVYETLRTEGRVTSILDQMLTRRQLYDLIGYDKFEALDASIMKTILPLSTG